ncbi:MAG: hypothetical protein M0R32_08650, partial [Candidatus Cloacimonetes bacterium]|nr:hypothetical protein [Candidatus Cloacimonadota bacterium]
DRVFITNRNWFTMEKRPEEKQNPMEEELLKIRQSRVGMSEILIDHIRMDNPDVKRLFVSTEMEKTDFRFPKSQKRASLRKIAAQAKQEEQSLKLIEKLSKVIKKWERKAKFCSKAGDPIGSSVYNDCVKTLHEIIHGTRKASGSNGLKAKNKKKEQ